MSDEAPFLKAVLAQPDDDTVRLAYADWLEENGQPERSKYIRIAIGLERKWSKNRDAVRAKKILARHEIEWLRGTPLVSVPKVWRRGFVEEVMCWWEFWRDYHATILAQHPVRKVKLTTVIPLSGRGRLEFVEPWVDDGIGRYYLPDDWPGIEFEAPPEPRFQDYADRYVDIAQDSPIRRMT